MKKNEIHIKSNIILLKVLDNDNIYFATIKKTSQIIYSLKQYLIN